MAQKFRPSTLADRTVRSAGNRSVYWRRNSGLRLRDSVGEVLLCGGLILLPFLATLDVGVAIGCREVGRPACLQLVSHAFAVPAMEELGMSE